MKDRHVKVDRFWKQLDDPEIPEAEHQRRKKEARARLLEMLREDEKLKLLLDQRERAGLLEMFGTDEPPSEEGLVISPASSGRQSTVTKKPRWNEPSRWEDDDKAMFEFIGQGPPSLGWCITKRLRLRTRPLIMMPSMATMRYWPRS
jgi:hypothetical protein